MKKTAFAIVAYSSGGQANATQLEAEINRIDTVDASGASVKLFTALKNQLCKIINNTGSHSVDIYPGLGDNFFGLSANEPMAISFGQSISVICFEGGEWSIV